MRIACRIVMSLGLAAVSYGAACRMPALAADKAAPPPPPVGLAELARVDQLPHLKESIKVGSVSSYDRTGGNDDGFSGRHSFLRKEGDGLVIADLKGPGCVYRIWTPTPSDDPIEFYFDGETAPRLRLPFRKLFDGTQAPFVAPVSGFGGGGFWTYLPLPYQRSLKVVVRAPRFQFYQINYATYPEGQAVTTFTADMPAPDRQAMEQVKGLFAASYRERAPYLAPPGTQVKTHSYRGTLQAGKKVVLYAGRKGGRVVGLRISPASALAGKDRGLVLRAYWDGDSAPAIQVPAGDFFGFSWGEPAARSLLVGTDGDTCYANFPMPFDRSARLELVSERSSGEPVQISAEVDIADQPRQPDEGRFYALWRRENPTRSGQPYTIVETAGRGHLVGVALQAQGMVSGNTYFFEGDDQATIDGELVVHGTGSEDFFNGGWYDVPGRWDSRVSFPLNGCLDYKKHLGRTGAYRLFLTDAYAFRKSLRLTIEHAPEGNTLATDYASVAYLYLQQPPAPAGTLLPLAQRTVQDFNRLVFTPGWNVPVHSFPFRNATLSKKTERLPAGGEVRYLSLRAEGDDVFGPHALSLLCEVPTTGRYRVSVEALRGPDQGRIQLFQDERAAGEAVDLYAEQRTGGNELTPLGVLDLKEGSNPVFLKLVGRHPQSKGLGLDLVTLQLERLP